MYLSPKQVKIFYIKFFIQLKNSNRRNGLVASIYKPNGYEEKRVYKIGPRIISPKQRTRQILSPVSSLSCPALL